MAVNKTKSISLAGLLSALVAVGAAEPLRNPAPTPPMGWNSFDSYGVYLHEKAAYANLEAMAVKLKPHGYEYFVVDNGWFGEYTLRKGTLFPAEKHAHDIHIDDYGRFQPSKVYFPGGLKPIADRCHVLGLKFGVHLMRGIPRKAYQKNLPIKGTPYTARDVANTDPKENCKWCSYCYAVDMRKPGAGVVRWTDSAYCRDGRRLHQIRRYRALPAGGRGGGQGDPQNRPAGCLEPLARRQGRPPAIASLEMANMLRVTNDVWDEQSYIDECFAAWRKWQGRASPGFWIDMDMIPFGQLQLMSPPGKSGNSQGGGDVALAGKGTTRWCQLTKPQMQTFIAMRLAASPLMVGGDLPTLDAFSYALITDPEMLACNQNGVMGSLQYERDGLETWRADKKGMTGRGWIGVFNRTSQETGFALTPAILGLDGTGCKLTEVGSGDVKTWGRAVKLPPHGVLFLKYD